MSIKLISISHKIAPLSIRQLFAFSGEQQLTFLQTLQKDGGFEECVIIATCNRTEIYTYGKTDAGDDFYRIQELLLREANASYIPHITDYLRLYQEEKAIHHLFLVASGLDSQVIGEDQILGQVKRALEQAREAGTAGVYLNTLFRYAITAAKRVKTDTDLSKSSVSAATLAIKAGEKHLGSLAGKKILLIGGSGQIGSAVLKNLCSIHGVEIYCTVRNVQLSHACSMKCGSFRQIAYKDRYTYLNEMDVVISATSSPHYTLTCERIEDCLKTTKSRVFVDLAVPPDLECHIGERQDVWFYNMDDFSELARENNQKKERSVKEADHILEEYEKEFGRWFVYQKAAPVIEEVKSWILEEAKEKGLEKAIDKFFYHLRDQALPGELENFLAVMEEMEK